jgi:hypothetical protein
VGAADVVSLAVTVGVGEFEGAELAAGLPVLALAVGVPESGFEGDCGDEGATTDVVGLPDGDAVTLGVGVGAAVGDRAGALEGTEAGDGAAGATGADGVVRVVVRAALT